jgi:hypothetical protein
VEWCSIRGGRHPLIAILAGMTDSEHLVLSRLRDELGWSRSDAHQRWTAPPA